MNDWPADPKLDASLRRLVGSEMLAARSDFTGIPTRARARRGRQAMALTGVGAVAVIAIVASLTLRMGPIHDGTSVSASGSAGTSEVVPTSPNSTPSGSPTVGPTAVLHGFTRTDSLDSSLDGGILLNDGRVLYAGGYDDRFGYQQDAELYDPKTGRFSYTGRMPAPRSAASVALLKDGRVLFAGGSDGSSTNLSSAVLYDPATGTFSPTGSMDTARWVRRPRCCTTAASSSWVAVRTTQTPSFVRNCMTRPPGSSARPARRPPPSFLAGLCSCTTGASSSRAWAMTPAASTP